MRVIAAAFALCLWMSAPAFAQSTAQPSSQLRNDDAGLNTDNNLPSDAAVIDPAGTRQPPNPLQATIDADRKAIADAENTIDEDWTLRAGKTKRKLDEKALEVAKKKLEDDLKACNLVATQPAPNAATVAVPACI